MKRHKYVALPLTLLIIFISLITFNTETHGKEDTLRVITFSSDIPGITTFSQSFDPDSYTVITQIFDSLIHLDLDGKMTPALATKWERVNPTTYRFHLRKNVKFHNGEPFNAEAVKFTYDTVLDPKTQSGTAWILGSIKEVRVTNEYEVEIETKFPDGMFLFRFSMFGSIAPPQYCKQYGLEYFEKYPVGTGPFKFQKWTTNKEIVLDANENYWRPGIPKARRLIYKMISEQKWADALVLGEVDLVPDLSGKQVRRIGKESNLKVMKRLVLSSYWVLLRNKGPLASLDVRKALNHAVNKEALVKYGDYGNAKPAASLGKMGEFGSNPDLTPYSYDPAKAKKLLAKAGYPDGFTLKAIAADTSANIAKVIKRDLENVGITMDLEVTTRPEWAKKIIVAKLTGKPWDGDIAINLVDNPIIDMSFHAGLFLQSGSPWALLQDKEYDDMFQAALSTSDLKEHEKRLQTLDRYIHDNALLLFTTQRIRTMGMGKNVDLPKVGINGHVDYFMLSDAVVK